MDACGTSSCSCSKAIALPACFSKKPGQTRSFWRTVRWDNLLAAGAGAVLCQFAGSEPWSTVADRLVENLLEATHAFGKQEEVASGLDERDLEAVGYGPEVAPAVVALSARFPD